MIQTICRIAARCICKKAAWALLVTLGGCGLLLYTHSYRAGAVLLAFTVVTAFAVFEEYHEADLPAEADPPALPGPIRISKKSNLNETA